MKVPNFSRSAALCSALGCLIIAPAVSLSEERQVTAFHPEQVSCAIRSIPEAHEYIEAQTHHPEGDLYLMAHAHEISARVKNLADKGDPEAMLIYGDLRRETLTMRYIFDKNGRHLEKHSYPDEVEDEITTAVTYINLAASFSGTHQARAQQLVRKVDAQASDVYVPSAWNMKAKAYAEYWRARCAK